MRIRYFSYVRTLGLFLVLLYHFYPKILQGGYIGVDIFFTFSGYLITALALKEVKEKKSFSLARFAERRFFRIFPTVAFAMLTILPITLLGSSDLRYLLREQTFAGLGFFTNLFEISTGISYENAAAPHLWVHLWSLALEVQFYVFWGLVIWLLVTYLGKKQVRGPLFLISSGLFLISFLTMFILAWGHKDYSDLYYSPLTHIFPFFLGASLASLAGIDSSPLIKNLAKKMDNRKIKFRAFYLGCFLVVLALVLNFNDKVTYLLGLFVVSLATGGLILYLRLLHEKTEGEESKVVKGISDLSYGVYIFHWAFLVIFADLKWNHEWSVGLTLLLSFSLSALVYYSIDPLLRGKRSLPKFEISYRSKRKEQVTKQGFKVKRIKSVRYNLVFPAVSALVAIFLILSGVSLTKSSAQTGLDQTLWQGGLVQANQQISLAERMIEKGTSQANLLVVGDSVTIGAQPDILATLPHTVVDAVGSRSISVGLVPELANYAPLLPKNYTLVIALGTNSVDPSRDIRTLEEVVNTYKRDHKIVLVTPANWGPGRPYNSDEVADYIMTLKGKYKNVAVADWRGISAGHPDYFDGDQIHIADRPRGRAAWLHTLEIALNSLGVSETR